MAQTRIRWIDIAKAIAIICMIIGHVVPWGTPVRNFIFSFHMPLFFILTGFTTKEIGNLTELFERIKKDFWHLLVPYIVLHVVDNLIGMSLYGGKVDILTWLEKLFWSSGVEVNGHPLIGTIWFLSALFWTKVLFSIIQYIIPERFRGIVVVASVMLGYTLAVQRKWLFLSWDIVLIAIFFLYVGNLFKRGLRFFEEYQAPIVATAFGIWMFLLNQGMYIEMATRHYPEFPLVLLQSVSGCVCIIALSREIEKYSGLSNLLCKIGSHTLLIMGMHHFSWRFSKLWGHGTFYDCVFNITFSCLLSIAILYIKKWLTDSYERWEKVFLTIVAIYFIRLYFSTTLFSLPWPRYFDHFLRLFAAITVWLKFECPGCKKDRRLLLGIITVAICMLSCFSNGYLFLWDLAVLIIGTTDIRYDKILKIYCVCGAAIFGLAVLGAFTGCIRDLVYSGPRHAFGIVYPTDFAAHVVFLALACWVLLRRIPYQVMAVIMAGLTYILYHYSRARCGTIVMGLSVIAVLYVGLTEKWNVKNRVIKGISGLIDRLLVIWMPLCAGLIIKLSMEYTSENLTMEAINDWISSRLRLANNAISEYGIKLFGTAFEMIGGGSDTVSRAGYNYVDSSYCLILLQYGVAVLLIICILNMWTAGHAVKAKKRKLLTAMALISIHSIIEHHLLELAYNPFLLMAFADIPSEEQAGQFEPDILVKKENRQVLFGYGLAALCGFWIMFKLLGYWRTIVSLLEFNQQSRNYIFVLLLLFTAVVSVMLVNCAIKSILKYINKRSIEKKEMIVFAQYAILLFWVIAGLEGTMRQKAGNFEESLDKGTQVIEKLRENGNSQITICVDDIPELYRREIGGVNSPLLTGASLLPETDILLITDKSKDIYLLTEGDFLFGELSDRQGVYTNSKEAVDVLESQGIKMADHYSVKNEVDLQSIAGANQLDFSENGGLLLKGPERSLAHGPWITLYRGTLSVEYRLKLLNSAVETGEVAKVRLSAESGKSVLEERSVNREDFDENGYCVVTIEKWIDSKEGMEFLVFANEGTSLEVEGISYGKIGK